MARTDAQRSASRRYYEKMKDSGIRELMDAGYREANRERIRANHKAWRDANPDKVKQYRKKTLSNPERAERYRERAKHKARETYALRRDQIKASVALRRARGARPSGADLAYAVVVRRDPCSYCGQPGGTMDHITAISMGGAGDWTNLTGACRSCNSRKKKLPVLLFMLRKMNIDIEVGKE